jgi:hypothetical protein
MVGWLMKYNDKLSGLYGWFCFRTQFWLKPENRITYSEMMWNFYHERKMLTCLILLAGGYVTAELTDITWSSVFFTFGGALLAHLFWNFCKNRSRSQRFRSPR